MKLRFHLAVLVAIVLLPILIFSAIVLDMLLTKAREAAFRSMHELARATVLAMDQEMTYAIATVRTLATSQRLANRNLAGFYQQAMRANSGGYFNTTLIDEQGQQVMNTIVPFGRALEPPGDGAGERVRHVIQNRVPHISDLIRGATTKRLVVTVEVPVRLEDGKDYALGQWMFINRLDQLLPRENVPASWLISVLDRKGVTIARNQAPDEFVGTAPREELRKLLLGPPNSEFRALNRAGVDMYGVNARSALSGWTVTIGVPVEEIEHEAVRAVSLTAFGLLAAIVCAIAGAVLFTRRLMRGINGVAQSAETLGQNRVPEISGLEVVEMNRLQVLLHEAGKRLQATDAERLRHLEEVQKAREHAEYQNRAKDNFLAMLGHELRNPLAPIAAAAELLKLSIRDDTRIRQASDIIARQANHMTSLIDDLLDVSRVTRGMIKLNIQPISIKTVMAEAIEQVRSAVEARRHILSIRLPAEPVWINGEKARLVQIFSNLISNSAKYTSEGGQIEVRAEAERDWLSVHIIDNGIGIPADLMPRIFDLFSQGNRSLDRTPGGMGLGLPLVKSLVELHGGTISAKSAGEGKGSEFTVRLPRYHGPVEANAGEYGWAKSRSKNSLRVVVVDDNRDAADVLVSCLKASTPHEVSVYYSATEAEARVAQDEAGIYILDIGLPDMDGYELARRIRERRSAKQTTLVALTGYGQEDDKQKAGQAGFDAHFTKPVNFSMLVELMDKVADGQAK
jgi:signal transduction histidine kinase/ActR/RegA family two-component response regulator